MVRSPYVRHPGDDDWGQAGRLVRKVLDDAARARLVSNIAGHLANVVTEPVLERAFQCWRNVDEDLGKRVEAAAREKIAGTEPAAGPSPVPAETEAAAV